MISPSVRRCSGGRGPRAPPGSVGAAALGGGAYASASAVSAAAAQAGHGGDHHAEIDHVLLISVDGLHQQDLAWYAKAFPGSVLAGLYHRGLEYSNASTPFPSDSFP